MIQELDGLTVLSQGMLAAGCNLMERRVESTFLKYFYYKAAPN